MNINEFLNYIIKKIKLLWMFKKKRGKKVDRKVIYGELLSFQKEKCMIICAKFSFVIFVVAFGP
jgi:hypothetical protein